MSIEAPLVRLPLGFEAERLRAEIDELPNQAWRSEPDGGPGVEVLLLLTPGGDEGDAAANGAIAPTPHLERSQYLRQALAGLGTVLGTTRLMRFDGEADVAPDAAAARYWAERVQVHIPIVPDAGAELSVRDRSTHLGPGEAWVIDAWRSYRIRNPDGERCVHLVVDTVGSEAFWRRVEVGAAEAEAADAPPAPRERVAYRAGASASLQTERPSPPLALGPWEQERLCSLLLDELRSDHGESPEARELGARLRAFTRGWRAAWAQHGPGQQGRAAYKRVLDELQRGIAPLEGRLRLENGADAVEVVRHLLVRPALDLDRARAAAAAGGRRLQAPPRRFERPIFIVGAPRGGSGVLFDVLARSPSIWAVRRPSAAIVERLPALHPANLGWDSNRLTPGDAVPRVADALRASFLAEIRDREGNQPPDDAIGLRLLDPTEKNALRLPFFNAAFPDAIFIYIHREPRETLTEIVAAWESKRFVTYPQLPGWPGPPWSLVLTPEWRNLAGKPVVEIAAEQWRMATRILLADLEKLAPERWCVVDYEALVSEPQREIERLCEFAGLEWDEELKPPLPENAHRVKPPDPKTWKGRQAEIEAILPRTAELAARSRDWLAHPPGERRGTRTGAKGSPFRSTVTATMPEVLGQLGGSLAVTTYQTGKLVLVRRAGDGLNTHFRNFDMPMGLDWQAGRLAIGTRSQIFEYHNLPDVAAKIEPRGSHDACFVPRRSHYTGDIRIHDVAFAGSELWIVATRFSCLATLDDRHSFVPRWRPRFVSALAAEDRCHLNGLAVIDDEVRFVTALGETDEAGGWRENKARGGVLIDVASSETVISGLSMPHSPRWYRDRLWLLESGEGTLATVDLDAGKAETVVELPGFTRGLAFAGPLAFVGLSEVRESSTFGGIPLTGRLEERQCGVWVVNIETAQVVAFLRFEDLVQELFEVKFLPGLRFPDLAEHGSEAINTSFVLPPEALREAVVPGAPTSDGAG